MHRKYVWALAAVAVIAVVMWAVTYYSGLSRFSNFILSMRSPATQTLGTPESGPVTYLPAPTSTVTTPGFVSPDSTPAAPVTAITPTSITVQTPAGAQSFTISSQTPVYSTVLVAEAGKSLADISVGSTIVVFWRADAPTVATALSFSRDEALSLTPEDNNHIVSGTIQGFTNTGVIIVPFETALPSVIITVDSTTKIATTVLAGQMGRRLMEGDIVVARGVSTVGDTTVAKAIVVAPPLPQ